MLVFRSLAALLIAATLALLLRPLLRARHVAAAPNADAAAISVYRDQKQALDAECADGVITPAERDAAVTELARRLGDEVTAVRSARTDQRVERRAWVVATALLVLIPTAAVVLYSRLGNPAESPQGIGAGGNGGTGVARSRRSTGVLASAARTVSASVRRRETGYRDHRRGRVSQNRGQGFYGRRLGAAAHRIRTCGRVR